MSFLWICYDRFIDAALQRYARNSMLLSTCLHLWSGKCFFTYCFSGVVVHYFFSQLCVSFLAPFIIPNNQQELDSLLTYPKKNPTSPTFIFVCVHADSFSFFFGLFFWFLVFIFCLFVWFILFPTNLQVYGAVLYGFTFFFFILIKSPR